MPKDLVGSLLQREDVDYIEEDGVMRAIHEPAPQAPECHTQQGATWGLVRSSEKMLDLNGEYHYSSDAEGAGSIVYVIDTGILLTHQEFASGSGGSRARWGTNTVDSVNTDENGHGTHCAGTVAGNTYGMAKKAHVVAVKVLNKQGQGTTAGVVQGVNWAAQQARSDQAASVGSMSLGGGKSQALNDAVDAGATDPTGPLITAVAAGNNNQDAANFSPASAAQVICVAASDNMDKKASFSNHGKTVTLYAPGVAVTSAWIGSNTATNTISGTSMACPHVAGQIAKFLQLRTKATSPEVKAWMTSVASAGLITGNVGQTPNLLLFADCGTFGLSANSSSVKLAKRY
jgi:cerevisin/serine protease